MPGKLNEKGEIASKTVHLSLARRCGDFIFTSAVGPWGFDPTKATYDANGDLLDDGSGMKGVPFAEQVHMTIANLRSVLESEKASLADVAECRVWLTRPADFLVFNEIYRTYFTAMPPTRSVFPQRFMFHCDIEMQAIAYLRSGG
jgi:enamine deaminase RidA (YjgF/YER057c/UK114 family)